MAMDSTNIKTSTAVSSSSQPSSKRLLFDRRYGWVFDDWRDPSEEALAGGRGMFCVLPIAQAFFKTTSQSINLAASFAVQVYKQPELCSPQLLKSSFSDWLHNIASSVQKPEFNCFAPKGNSPSDSIINSSNLHINNRE